MIKITDNLQVKSVLKSLKQSVSDIEGCSVVSLNGLVLASELMAEVENEALAALSANITRSGAIVSSELKIGKISPIIISSPKGEIITTEIGKKAILVCLIKPKANLGFVLLHMNRAALRLVYLL